MLAAGTGLGALRAAASVYYNYTGQSGACFDVGGVSEEAAKFWHRKGQRQEMQRQTERYAAKQEEMTVQHSAGATKGDKLKGDKLKGDNLAWTETQAGYYAAHHALLTLYCIIGGGTSAAHHALYSLSTVL
jgi:hypothetical protein